MAKAKTPVRCAWLDEIIINGKPLRDCTKAEALAWAAEQKRLSDEQGMLEFFRAIGLIDGEVT